jgi:hypothetical protein
VAPAAYGATLYTAHGTGTYYEFGQDIALLAQQQSIPLAVRKTEGSVENIKRINASDGIALGIVQSDVLAFLERSQNAQSKKIIANLRAVFPLYPEEVHVLARSSIHEFKELQGKKVAVGEDGSGHMLTAVNLFALEQIVPSDIEKISPEEGIVGVLKGDIDAVVFVGGKPVKLFKNMEALAEPENRKFTQMLEQVHFLPLNSARFYEEYEPTEIGPEDYHFVKQIVPTIAVPSLLVSLDFSNKPAKKAECETIAKLAAALREGVPVLQQTGHPKWKEVNLDGNVFGWKKDACAWAQQ